MKFLSLILISIITFSSCQKKEIFLPVNQSKENYLQSSQEYSKSREENERKYLQKWVDKRKDSLQQIFEPTSGGIWIRFINKEQKTVIKKNDIVEYTAEIKSLSGNLIYSTTEFGKKQIILGKFKEIRGIETALYRMGKGDVAELLLPSFTAYGVYGDENKIQSNLPLVVELHILNVQNNP